MVTVQEQPRRFTWLRAVLTVAAGIAVGLAFAAGIVLLIATRLFNYQLLTVESGSMSPSLETGDLVFIRPIAPADVAQRDVILFLEQNTRVPVVHRVVAVQRETTQVRDGKTGVVLRETTHYNFKTQGDANPTIDAGNVGPDQLKGKVLFYIPTFGLIGSGGGTEWWLLGFGAFMGLAWGGWEFYNHRRQARAKRRRPRRATSGGGTGAPAKARILKPRRPSIGRRVLDYSLDRADDALYFGAVVLGRARSGMRASSRRTAALLGLHTGTGRTQRTPRAGPGALALPHGAGLWLLLPIAVWGTALVVMLAGSAAAEYGRPDIPGKFAAAGAASSEFIWLPPGATTTPSTTPCAAPASALAAAVASASVPSTAAPPPDAVAPSADVAGPINPAAPVASPAPGQEPRISVDPFGNVTILSPFFLSPSTPSPKSTKVPASVSASVSPARTPTPPPPTPTPTPAPRQDPAVRPSPCAVDLPPTPSPTATPTTAAATASRSPSPSPTETPTPPAPSATSSTTASPPATASPTETPTSSATATTTPTATATATAPTSTATATATAPTSTATATATAPTSTATATATATATTPTSTATATATTPTSTATASTTATQTATASATPTP